MSKSINSLLARGIDMRIAEMLIEKKYTLAKLKITNIESNVTPRIAASAIAG
jgi:hypothetical protein